MGTVRYHILIYYEVSKYYPERQRYTLPTTGKEAPVALVDGKTIGDYPLKDGDVLLFKDLGK